MRARLPLFACFFGAMSCLGQLPNPSGSGSSAIVLDALTEVQVNNLVILGKVWGFLKYHHPAVTSGQKDWDRELLEVMPRVLSASDRRSADVAIVKWIQDLGPVADCDPCALLPDHPALLPDTHWLEDQAVLGPELSRLLQRVLRSLVQSAPLSFAVAGGGGELILETVLAKVLLKEQISARRAAGTLLVLCGVVLFGK
jgi:hypothetical protein